MVELWQRCGQVSRVWMRDNETPGNRQPQGTIITLRAERAKGKGWKELKLNYWSSMGDEVREEASCRRCITAGNQPLLELVLEGGSGEEIPLPLSPPGPGFSVVHPLGELKQQSSLQGAEGVQSSGAEKSRAWIWWGVGGQWRKTSTSYSPFVFIYRYVHFLNFC